MTRSRSIMPRAVACGALLLLPLGASCGGGSASLSGTGLNTAQTVLDLTDAVSGLQQRDAEMQGKSVTGQERLRKE